MAKLVQIDHVWVDPTRVLSIWHPMDDVERIMFSVNQEGWTQQFEIVTDEDSGWTRDSMAEYLNEYR